MSKLDLTLKRYPDHEEELRLLASRDPSKTLKYLDWGARMLEAKQALAPEIADITELFHRFNGQAYGKRKRVEGRIHTDIYTYRPQDLARLRDNLLRIKKAADTKRRKRERLYRIEGPVEADTIYDSDDLIVRHIKNKEASVHYGHGTKWCIAMKRDGYFEDYETHNATFFFFERKTPLRDEFDKVALMIPRVDCGDRGETAEAFTAFDFRVDMMRLAKVYGPRIFDIFRAIYECSDRYPGSVMARVYDGTATEEQLKEAFESVVKNKIALHEVRRILQAICCNDAAPRVLLEEVARRAPALALAAEKKRGRRAHRMFRSPEELPRVVMAALSIHPNIPLEEQERLGKELRRRRVNTRTIHRTKENGGIGIDYGMIGGTLTSRRRRRFRRPQTVKQLERRAGVMDRYAARMRKKAKALKLKQAATKKRKKK